MHKRMTITLDEAVYEGLYRTIGKRRMSQFIENLQHPCKAKAVHARADADLHVVGIGELRVLLCEQRGEWFAQGIEVAVVASFLRQNSSVSLPGECVIQPARPVEGQTIGRPRHPGPARAECAGGLAVGSG